MENSPKETENKNKIQQWSVYTENVESIGMPEIWSYWNMQIITV